MSLNYFNQPNHSNWALDVVGQANTSSTVKIAIVDSGINKTLPALKHINFKEFNTLNPQQKIVDDFGHGTAIAGIIAAKSNELEGVLKDVVIYDVKVLDSKGQGEVNNVIEGIDWSIKNKVDVINISFGFSVEYLKLKQAIERAVDSGILVVAAAGNTLGLSEDYPAKYEGVISIGSLTKDLNLASHSSTNADFLMPGEDVLSLNKENDFTTFTGTSFAAAYASAVIGAIKKKESISSYNEFQELVENYVVFNNKSKVLTLKK